MATIEDMEEIVFGCCGAVVWLPKNLLAEKRKTGESFYCPNGHSRCYRETTADKLLKELDAAKKDLAEKNQKIQNIKSGSCPFCRKTVKDISSHIERRHR